MTESTKPATDGSKPAWIAPRIARIIPTRDARGGANPGLDGNNLPAANS